MESHTLLRVVGSVHKFESGVLETYRVPEKEMQIDTDFGRCAAGAEIWLSLSPTSNDRPLIYNSVGVLRLVETVSGFG